MMIRCRLARLAFKELAVQANMYRDVNIHNSSNKLLYGDRFENELAGWHVEGGWGAIGRPSV